MNGAVGLNLSDVSLASLQHVNIEALLPVILGWAVNLVTAILIAIFAIWLAGFSRRRVIAVANRYPKLDNTLFSFLGSLVRYAVLAIAGIFILNRFGIQTASLIALLGAAGLAIGLALQGTLSHLAAGVMLILFRPIKVGDYVTAGGQSGTVKDITLFTTELATLDNVQIIVPNGTIWSASITNYSVYTTRRIELIFGVSYGTDLAKAEAAIRGVIEGDDRIHPEPEPFVKVTALNNSSVDFMVRVWCSSADFFVLKADLTRKVKEEFDAQDIEIPFPTTTLVRGKS